MNERLDPKQVVRLSVPLDEDEANALLRMASAERRHPREQARELIRRAAVQCGLLAVDPVEVRLGAATCESPRNIDANVEG